MLKGPWKNRTRELKHTSGEKSIDLTLDRLVSIKRVRASPYVNDSITYLVSYLDLKNLDKTEQFLNEYYRQTKINVSVCTQLKPFRSK